MDTKVLFSILIPAYKIHYLKECIDSILSQTYGSFEIIIVDDASPFDIWSVVSLYDDERIKYYRNEVGFGAKEVVENWNKCLEYASGDYVICMGDDDRLLSNCLEQYVTLIDKYPGLGVYHSWTEIIDSQGDIIAFQESRPERESLLSIMYFRLSGRREQFIGDWLFDVKMLREVGGFYKLPLAWGSDDITVYRAASMGAGGCANTQYPCFQYRKNNYTISNSSQSDIKIEAHMLHRKWLCGFINNLSISEKSIDPVFFNLINNHIDLRFQQLIWNEVSNDILLHPKRFFYWVSNRNKLRISIRHLISLLIRGLLLNIQMLLTRFY